MSDSRLEKFIYAICSMEVSDLPAPLSRIEKLWNCLITGAAPDFEPLSRNEKYLMAMIGSYDISNLPAPMSRGEKLLYKITVGETDLSDVPGYLSRYEELLKYLIENGGIGGGDFEYVLHTLNQSLSTLYNTAEKPVKSAILKGQTLVNLAGKPKSVFCGNGIDMTFIYDKTSYANRSLTVKPNTTYTIFNFNDKKISSLGLFSEDNVYVSALTLNGNSVITHTTSPDTAIMSFMCRNTEGWTEEEMTNGNNIMVIEGDYTNVNIPYFEGMQSVKMPVLMTTGKNLFNESEKIEGYISANSTREELTTDRKNTWTTPWIKAKTNTSYAIQGGNRNRWQIKSRNNVITFMDKKTITTLSDTEYIRCYYCSSTYTASNVQVEEGSTTTSYEPHKTNILTVNEPIELRGIGDVKDTLDCLTGEMTERIGEIVLDGSENWIIKGRFDNVVLFYNGFNICPNGVPISEVKSDRLISKHYYRWIIQNEGIYLSTSNEGFFLSLSKARNIDTTDKLKQWLSQNEVTVQYRYSSESIKTVDLTTVDQDGQPTKLKTFNDITHVEIKVNNLIPSVDVEVATKISQTLSTMGPQQLNISETQDKLGQTVDKQTENTDATMMATTEIYEQTL